MTEYYHDEEQEPRKQVVQDYYAGYYWGNDPYESYDLPGRKSDSELKKSILERLHKNCSLMMDSITFSVENGTVVLTGQVKTYKERFG
jgi:osmotically-inducible protein OsmY